MRFNSTTVKGIESDPALIYHHSALKRGYISRKADPIVSEYSGRFGTGYTVEYARYDTSRYHTIQYFIRKEV